MTAVAGLVAACGRAIAPSGASPTASAASATSASLSSTAPTLTPSAAVTVAPSISPVPSPVASPDIAALRRKLARMLLVGFRGMELTQAMPITSALAGGLGGVILFDHDQTTGKLRNISSPAQLARLTASIRSTAGGPVLIAADQEGGKVSRLNPAQGFPATRTQATIGATGDTDQALAAGRAMGATMAAAGIDLDLAPVVDMDINPTNPAIGALGRSFSAKEAVVASMAAAEIRGLHEHGIRSAIKHFPGLGSASANTDFAKADVTATWTEVELAPYRTLIELGLPDAIMSANILDRKLDPTYPASLSSRMVDGMLRRQLGWQGVVVTDDLGAVAITSSYAQAEAIALAIEAGNDLLTFANQASYVDDLVDRLLETMVGLVTSGRIPASRIDASIARLDALAGH